MYSLKRKFHAVEVYALPGSIGRKLPTISEGLFDISQPLPQGLDVIACLHIVNVSSDGEGEAATYFGIGRIQIRVF